ENVGKLGLKGSELLTKKDIIIVLVNQHMYNASILKKAHLELSEAQAFFSGTHNTGKNSTDFCIVTFLGYLIKKFGKKYKYVIISKDNGFKSVTNYWKDKGFYVTTKDSIYNSLNEDLMKNKEYKPLKKIDIKYIDEIYPNNLSSKFTLDKINDNCGKYDNKVA
ncbi:MAG: hypothetical protein K6G15_12050, partial [Desulfovibrio sp.]|nr:hypothetical protein [Desulfovibrio sp.]